MPRTAVATRTKECVRCIKNTRGTERREVPWGDSIYVLVLCESHDRAFDREMYGWLRLGEVVTVEPEREPWIPDAWRNRPQPVRLRPVPEPAAAALPAPTPIRPRIVLPPEANLWRCSLHATERQDKREITDDEVLLAAVRPGFTMPSRLHDTRIHVRDDVAVVVDDRRKVVVTVLPRGSAGILALAVAN